VIGRREDPELSELIFLWFFFTNLQGLGGERILSSPSSFSIVFLNKPSGKGRREDPEFSELIFLLFFSTNRQGKGGGRILSSPR
jgi:hypothetical protein